MSHSRECIRQSGYNVHCICGAERTENNVLRAELDAVRADLELLSERDCEHWSRHCDAEREVVKLRAEVERLTGIIAGFDCEDGCGCGKRHCAQGEEAECVACLLTRQRDEARAAASTWRGRTAAACRERDEARAEVEKLTARHASDYETLRAFDTYGTGGDIAACVREVTLRLSEAREEVERLKAELRKADAEGAIAALALMQVNFWLDEFAAPQGASPEAIARASKAQGDVLRLRLSQSRAEAETLRAGVERLQALLPPNAP